MLPTGDLLEKSFVTHKYVVFVEIYTLKDI